MKTIQVANGIFRLFFDAAFNEGAESQDIILLMLQDGDRALLIDTGYPEQAFAARAALEAQGIRPQVLLLSHYHPDHVAGCVAFEDCEIIAHPAYRRSYEFYQKIFPDQRYIEPTRLVEDGERFRFGCFELELLATPGHSPCGLTTLVDGRIAHIGDLLAYGSDGRMTLPLIASGGDFQAFIDSLTRLSELDVEMFMPVHGSLLHGRDALERDTGQVIHYLERMLATRGEIPLAELLDQPLDRYSGQRFHDTNLKRLRKMLGE